MTVVTELSTSRREHILLLTRKLEELYTLVNEAAERNVEYLQLYKHFMHDRNVEVAQRLADFPLFASVLQKKVVLFVRLYFPALSKAHVAMVRQLSQIHQLIYNDLNGAEVEAKELEVAFLAFGDCLRAFEEEMIENKTLLVGRFGSRFRYRKAVVKSPWKDAVAKGDGPLTGI